MSKKRKHAQRKGQVITPRQVERWLDQAFDRVARADYEGAVHTCQRLMRYTSPQTPQRARALESLGLAHAMLQQFDDAYAALSEAVSINPDDADLWYNRGLSSRFTMRFGQAVKDFERAAALEKDEQMAARYAEELSVSREMAERERALRGPDLTLEQLIEQEEYYHQAVELMRTQQWSLAEQAFRQVIQMGDSLPQPWGNLGGCLIMQQRYDEAEAALKRALGIDPNYRHARDNLALLPETRQLGHPPTMQITHPFEGHQLKKSIVFRKA